MGSGENRKFYDKTTTPACSEDRTAVLSVQSHRPDSHSLLVINFGLAYRLLSPSSFGKKKKKPQRHSLVLSLLASRLDHIASSLIDHEHPNNALAAVNCGGTVKLCGGHMPHCPHQFHHSYMVILCSY